MLISRMNCQSVNNFVQCQYYTFDPIGQYLSLFYVSTFTEKIFKSRSAREGSEWVTCIRFWTNWKLFLLLLHFFWAHLTDKLDRARDREVMSPLFCPRFMCACGRKELQQQSVCPLSQSHGYYFWFEIESSVREVNLWHLFVSLSYQSIVSFCPQWVFRKHVSIKICPSLTIHSYTFKMFELNK